MTSPVEPIPPSQLFRALLLHMLETHKALAKHLQYHPSKELSWCHSQNAYILSEIGSWLEDQTEDSDLTPSFSTAQGVELLRGVESSLLPLPTPVKWVTSAGRDTAPSAPPALPAAPRGKRPGASSRQRDSTAPALERTSDGKIVFRQKS